MKKYICHFVIGVILFSLNISARSAIAARGEVTHRISGCDYFLVETVRRYVVLEWGGGNDPDKGDRLVGAFENYGMKTIYNETADAELRVWVEDYLLSKEDALEAPRRMRIAFLRKLTYLAREEKSQGNLRR